MPAATLATPRLSKRRIWSSVNALTRGIPRKPWFHCLLREDTNLDVILLLVDVDREVLKLVDDLIEVFRLDLAHVEVHPLLPKSLVDPVLGDGRDHARESHAGAQKRDRHPHVDVDGFVVLPLLGIDHDPYELGHWLGLNGSSCGCGGRGRVAQSADEAVGLVRVDLALGQHLQYLPAFLCHFSSSS